MEADSDKRFHVELHFSPGAYADFDVPQYLIKNEQQQQASRLSGSSNEDLIVKLNNLSSEVSHHQNISSQHKILNSSRAREKRSPVKSIGRKLPFRLFNSRELQTLPEPSTATDLSNSFELQKNNESDESMQNAAESEAKPRSFEDEHHQRRMLIMKMKLNTAKELYNHYNTFHGSGTSNYLSLAQVFRNRTTSFGTNSSPDLNQNLVGKTRKSVPSKSKFFFINI